MTLFLEQFHAGKGLDPVADAHAGGVASDIVNMSAWGKCTYLVYRGVATGGTAAPTYTVEACDDTTPSNTSAVAFHYRKVDSTDIEGEITEATATGFQATAGSSKVDIIEVSASALAASGYKYVRLAIAETVNDPVVSAVLILLSEPRHRGGIAPTVLT